MMVRDCCKIADNAQGIQEQKRKMSSPPVRSPGRQNSIRLGLVRPSMTKWVTPLVWRSERK